MLALHQKARRRCRGNNKRRGYFFTEKQQGAHRGNAVYGGICRQGHDLGDRRHRDQGGGCECREFDTSKVEKVV